MHSDRHPFLQNTKLPLLDQVGSGNIRYPPIGSTFFSQHVDFQPSKICPRNFVIFDRTDNRSQFMHYPAMAPKFDHSNVIVRNDENAPKEAHSVMKENSADIDFLLSFEEEECEDEEVSTARTTHGNDDNDTADSCSLKNLKKTKLGLCSFSHKSRGSCEGKRDKIRKMVNSLRGIVPGGNRMSTVAVIDEVVKYLNSVKVELQKAGVENLKD
ncbi:transcription factor bHLH144-like [Bidens hawaiensis]|uniref:transcription factor bHLH144-like n=1 Tax=Bidens hawaiensis TaxID=980011 RepID=UPI004049B5B6